MSSHLTLDTEAVYIPGVGPKIAEKLERLEIFTVRDMLYHVPRRYNDFSRISPISNVQPGEILTIRGSIETIKGFRTKTGKQVQEAMIADKSGSMRIIWFNQVYLLRILREGMTVSFSGKVDWFGRKLVMYSPQFEISGHAAKDSLHTGRLVPVYPETEGISSKRLRARIAHLLEVCLPLDDPLPDEILQTHNLPSLTEALASVHFPETLPEAERARMRLAIDEVLTLMIRAYITRKLWESKRSSHSLQTHEEEMIQFISTLPFKLTEDQTKAIEEIHQNLQRNVPMNRLLQGDVGSGKTVVAAISMYIAYKNGFSSILMAPTQILAEQHFQTVVNLMKPLNISVDLITSDTKTISNTQSSLFKKSQTPSIVIGTHALLSFQFDLEDIGLVVVDEQQRFGVEQRGRLIDSAGGTHTPHLLTMTATPIPRTLAKSMLGTVDVSTLEKAPAGRKRVKTWVVPEEKRFAGYEWIKKQMKKTGGQTFFIFPLIEESEAETLSEIKAVKGEFDSLQDVFSDFSLGLLHGKLSARDKSTVLSKFQNKEYDILVSTPVVEVGIDIPNACIMVIDGADRFGLSQLHQLRGRVGRGVLESYCLLFTTGSQDKTITRLKAMETTFSGPKLSEVDLVLRGPGEVFGKKQHGLPQLKIAEFVDNHVFETSRTILDTCISTDPEISQLTALRDMAKKSTIANVNVD